MGLGFVGAKSHWSYSGFNNFRKKLANEIGVCLDLMEGFWIENNIYSKVENTKRNVGDLIMEQFHWLPQKPLKWDKIKDPIVDLLNHSDCEGSLTPSQCKKIAVRLRELVSSWHDEDYDKQQALLLAEGMEECSKKRRKLQFC
jgi:hypothetical protein